MTNEHFLVIKNHLVNSIPDLELVQLDLGQYAPDINNSISLTASPALLIGFDVSDLTTNSRHIQFGILTLSVQVLVSTRFGSDDDLLKTNLLGLTRQVYQAMQQKGFSKFEIPDYPEDAADRNDVLINPLDRKEVILNDGVANSIASTTTLFQAPVFDYSAIPAYQQTIAELNLTVDYL